MSMLQSLLIAAPVFYLALGLLLLSRAQWHIPEEAPFLIIAWGVVVFLALGTWHFLTIAGKDAHFGITRDDDE